MILNHFKAMVLLCSFTVSETKNNISKTTAPYSTVLPISFLCVFLRFSECKGVKTVNSLTS